MPQSFSGQYLYCGQFDDDIPHCVMLRKAGDAPINKPLVVVFACVLVFVFVSASASVFVFVVVVVVVVAVAVAVVRVMKQHVVF